MHSGARQPVVAQRRIESLLYVHVSELRHACELSRPIGVGDISRLWPVPTVDRLVVFPGHTLRHVYIAEPKAGAARSRVRTEWLRTHFDPGPGDPLVGVLYESSRNPGGVNLSLFIDNDGACDPDQERGSALLVLDRHERLDG